MTAGVAAILLAAGLSRRFGDDDKLLALLDGEPVIVHTARAIAACGLADFVAVTGRDDEARRAALSAIRVRHVVVDAPQRGQGASIAAGIAAGDPRAVGVMIVPADMPRLDGALLDRLIGHFMASGATDIVFPTAGGAQRPPVIWPRSMFDELRRLDGDSGGKAVIRRHAAIASPVALDEHEAACLDDVDTPADLDRIANRMAKASDRRAS